MSIESLQIELDAPKTIAIDWAEAEWFQVWLKLARGQGQENANTRNIVAEPEPVAA